MYKLVKSSCFLNESVNLNIQLNNTLTPFSYLLSTFPPDPADIRRLALDDILDQT